MSGGGTGIGRAITRELVAAGTDVVIVGRRREPLRAAAVEVNELSGRDAVRVVQADLRDPDQAAAVTAGLGRVDVVVNNAGGNFVSSPRAGARGICTARLPSLTPCCPCPTRTKIHWKSTPASQ